MIDIFYYGKRNSKGKMNAKQRIKANATK